MRADLHLKSVFAGYPVTVLSRNVSSRGNDVPSVDTYFRTGLYPVSFPFTLGQEGSGVIVKLPTAPEVLENEDYKRRGFQIGDRVAAVRPTF